MGSVIPSKKESTPFKNLIDFLKQKQKNIYCNKIQFLNPFTSNKCFLTNTKTEEKMY